MASYDIQKEIELEEMKEKMEKWRGGEVESTERRGRSKKRSDSLKMRAKSGDGSLGTRSLSDDRSRYDDDPRPLAGRNGKRSRSPIKKDIIGLARRLGQVALDGGKVTESDIDGVTDGGEAKGRTDVTHRDEEEVETSFSLQGGEQKEGVFEPTGRPKGGEDASEVRTGLLEETKAVVLSKTELLSAQARPKMDKWKRAMKKMKDVVTNEGSDGEEEMKEERVTLSPAQVEGKIEERGDEGQNVMRWGLPRALNQARTEIYGSTHLSEVEEVAEEEDGTEMNYGTMTVEELMRLDTKMREEFNQVCNENEALMENIAAIKYDHEAQRNHNAEKWAAKQQEFEQMILDRESEIEILEQRIESMKGDSMEVKTTKEMLDKKYAEAAVMMNTIEKQENEIKEIRAQLNNEKMRRSQDLSDLEKYRETLDEQKRETESLRKMRSHLEGNMKKSDRRLRKRNPSMLSLNRGGDLMVIDNPDGEENNFSSASSSEESEVEEEKEDVEERKKDGGKKKTMSKQMARREIRDYIWPNMADFTTEEGFKNMFKKQIMRARQDGIPKKTIANSVCMALLKNRRTADMYSELSDQYDTSSLSGVLKIIDNLDSEQNSRNATERFYEICMEESETARSYLGRLKRAHRALFPRESERETNMIRKQFLEGFRYKGQELDESDKKYLYNTPELNDLCTRAMFVVKENQEKERKKEVRGKERTYRELNTVDYDVEATRQRRTESVQASYRGRPNRGPPQTQRDHQTSASYGEYSGQSYGPRRPEGQQRPPPNQYSRGPPRQGIDTQNRVSAGPDAQRVTEEEYRKGQANNGDMVCYRCCTRNHIALNCPYVSYCVFCKKETNHPSRAHNDNVTREAKGGSTA